MVTTPPHPPRVRPPLDAPALERLALRYVERYATTRARLARYLARKVGERGWSDERAVVEDAVAALVERVAALGYVDDRAFGEARAAAMARRGLGRRRVAAALADAGVRGEDAEALAPEIAACAVESAVAFARRKRLGPYGSTAPDRALRERHIAAFLRAGHGYDLARRIVDLAPGEDGAEMSQNEPAAGLNGTDFDQRLIRSLS